jgi:hypothetical protein
LSPNEEDQVTNPNALKELQAEAQAHALKINRMCFELPVGPLRTKVASAFRDAACASVQLREADEMLQREDDR